MPFTLEANIVRRPLFKKLAFAIVLLIAFAGMMFATRSGAGLTPDSLTYVNAARQLMQGQPLTEIPTNGKANPYTHFPPLFPVLMAIISTLLRTDPLQAGQYINCLLFGLNALLVALVLHRAGSRIYIVILGVIFMLAADEMIYIHVMVWSEPLFILLMLSGIYFLQRFFQSNKLSDLAISALAVGLSALVRYVGVVFIVAEFVCVLFLARNAWRTQLRLLLLQGVVASTPIAFWSIRNIAISGSASDRQLFFHPLMLSDIVSGMSIIRDIWVFNARPMLVPILTGIILGIFVVVLWQMRQRTGIQERVKAVPSLSFPTIGILFILAYIGFLIFSISFFDASIPVDERILAPAYVLALLVVMPLLPYALEQRKSIARASAIILSVILTSYIVNDIRTFPDWNGRGYAAPKWQLTALFDRIRAIPNDVIIYSDDSKPIYFFVGRAVYDLPRKINRVTSQPNQNYATERSEMRAKLNNGQAVLIDFVQNTLSLASTQDLLQGLSLRVSYTDPTGSIYVDDNMVLIAQPKQIFRMVAKQD